MPFRLITLLILVLAFALPNLVSADEEYWEYTFRPGDSIWKIAEKYTTTVNNWLAIQELNKIHQGPDRRIPPGTRIQIPVSMLKLQPTPALVIAVSGKPELVRANGDIEAVVVGTKLYSGDRVHTTETQLLRTQFADKSELQVLPNSEVVLDKLSHHQQTGMVDTRIRLNTGSVNTWVEKQRPDSHYEIRTPAAITAVRGTAFRLSSDTDQVSRTEVTEGTVAVSAGVAEKAVQDGYGIVAEIDKPLPEPVKLLAPPVISDNLVADNSRLKVSWQALDGAQLYRFQLASDARFDQPVVHNTTTENTLSIDPLPPGRYYLSVRGVDPLGLEGFDTVRQYEILQPPPPPPPVENDDYWKTVMSIGIVLLFL